MKTTRFLHPRYHPRIIGHILKNAQKSMSVCFNEIRLIIMRMKNRLHVQIINKTRP